MKTQLFGCLIAAFSLVPAIADASVIIAPVSGTINQGGPGFGTLTETFDQSGLLTGYTAGVTDFNTYLASNPIHTFVFAGNEWFSNQNFQSPVIVTYDFGSVKTFDALALWNEEASGIGSLELQGSTDGASFSTFASGLSPTDNALSSNYGADVFGFAAQTARFVRFIITDFPQPISSFQAAAIGEVAFRQARGDDNNNPIPEPATVVIWSLMAAMGLVVYRRRKSA